MLSIAQTNLERLSSSSRQVKISSPLRGIEGEREGFGRGVTLPKSTSKSIKNYKSNLVQNQTPKLVKLSVCTVLLNYVACPKRCKNAYLQYAVR